MKVRLRCPNLTFALDLSDDATFWTLCGLVAEEIGVDVTSVSILQAGFPPQVLEMQPETLISTRVENNESLYVQVRESGNISTSDGAVQSQAIGDGNRGPKAKGGGRRKLTAVEKSVKAAMMSQRAVSQPVSSSSSSFGASVAGLHQSAAGSRGGGPTKRGARGVSGGSSAASPPKRRAPQTQAMRSEDDVSFALLTAAEAGTTSRRDKALRKVYRRAVELQYDQSKAESRVAALISGKYTFEDLGSVRTLGTGAAAKMKVRYHKGIHGRGSFEDVVDVIDATKLRLAIALVLADGRENPDALEMLKPMNMAGVSPRTLWSIVRLHGPDTTLGLRALVPSHDWGFVESGRKRTLSEKAQANVTQAQEGVVARAVPSSTEPTVFPALPVGSAPPLVPTPDPGPNAGPGPMDTAPTANLGAVLISSGISVLVLTRAQTRSGLPASTVALPLLRWLVLDHLGDGADDVDVLTQVAEVATCDSASPALSAMQREVCVQKYPNEVWRHWVEAARGLVVGAAWHMLLARVAGILPTHIGGPLMDDLDATLRRRALTSPSLLSAMATSPESFAKLVHSSSGVSTMARAVDEEPEQATFVQQVGAALTSFARVRAACEGWFDAQMDTFQAGLQAQSDHTDGGEEDEHAGDDDGELAHTNMALLKEGWSVSATIDAHEWVQTHLGKRVSVGLDEAADAASDVRAATVVAHLPAAVEDGETLEALYKVEFAPLYGTDTIGDGVLRRDLDEKEMQWALSNVT